MAVRLGEFLVKQGVLNEAQVDEILEAQKESGRPFGDLAERMFNIPPETIESAWCDQFTQVSAHVKPIDEAIDPDIFGVIERRQAWQFGVVPLRREGQEVVMVTTRSHLSRATRFAGWHMREPVYFVLCEPGELEEALKTHYPMDGMDLDQSAFKRLQASA